MAYYIREEGWKELKVGCVFEEEVRGEQVPETEDLEERAQAVHTSNLGVLGPAGASGRHPWMEAVRGGVPWAHERIVIGDGAHWIWDLAQEHLGSSWQVVDWYHAKQHLYRVAALAFGEGSPTGQQWVKTVRTPLYQGQIWQVAKSIHDLAAEVPQVAKSLRTEAG